MIKKNINMTYLFIVRTKKIKFQHSGDLMMPFSRNWKLLNIMIIRAVL